MPPQEIPNAPFEIVRPLNLEAVDRLTQDAYGLAAHRLRREGAKAGMDVVVHDLRDVKLVIMGEGSLRYAMESTDMPDLSLSTIRRELALALPGSFARTERVVVEGSFANNRKEPSAEQASKFGVLVGSAIVHHELRTAIGELSRQTNTDVGARNRLNIKLGYSPQPLPTREHSIAFRRALEVLQGMLLPLAKIKFTDVEEKL